MFAPVPVPPQFFETLPREMMVRPGQIRANAEDAVFMIPAAAGFRKRYGQLSMPVRLLAGAEDKIVDPQAHSMRLQQELPASRLTVVPGAGHMVHYAVPELVVADVDAVAGSAGSAAKQIPLLLKAHPAAGRATPASASTPAGGTGLRTA